MSFSVPGAAEILRAAQKDDSFLVQCKSCLSDIIQRIAGTRTWLNIHKQVEMLSELTYYSLTTLSVCQTLGEEYTGLLQVDNTGKSLPSKQQRTFMVLLHCFGPELMSRLLLRLESSLRSGQLSLYLRPELRQMLVQNMPSLKHGLTLLHRLHLAMFYFSGDFYHVAKRAARIQYVLVRKWLGDNDGSSHSFRLLGFVLFVHAILMLFYSLYNKWLQSPVNEIQTDSAGYIDAQKQCSLCLNERKDSSVTPCGHVFCWQCIHKCLQLNSQCPICRFVAVPSQIVPLMNYDGNE